MSEWISVDDRLPQVMSLCWYRNDYEFCMMIGSQLSIYKDDMWHIAADEVAYWQPLPEPPQ